MSPPLNILGVDQFKTEVLDEKLPVLVDFWAPWCGPCQMMAPVLEEIAKQFDGKLKVAKVDTEQSDNRSLAFDYQIMSIPNLKLFYQGKIIKDFVGFRPAEMFTGELNDELAKIEVK